ncbi:Agamous-like MADS-box protein AGL80 [Rhynchospora pubera]|uniref:Agamous-like MADS-box protein AGL80 n=1 Tax=Rhynchospora pubera TaxID=906938 RepID=A0AAV8H136_9POAL|nr:Agamous-like MADS-box protein AGL80 [Rhynchospora pubera]KAJ4810340.1 Agamous-like MADS-box protein AGL80 [Rhynchospora pubera]
MGRSKLNLEFIAKYSKRLATFKKRKESVLKKARELGTLCDIRLCVVIESPDMPGYQVFPSEEEARELLHMFNNMPNKKKGKSATPTTSQPEPGPEEMLRQEVIDAREQLEKLDMENRELQSEILMHEYMTGARTRSQIGSEEARDILQVVEERLRAVQARIDVLSPASAIAAQIDVLSPTSATAAQIDVLSPASTIAAQIDVLYSEANTVENSPPIAAQPDKQIVEDTVDTELRLRAVQARIDVLSPASAIAALPDKEIVEDTVDTELRL